MLDIKALEKALSVIGNVGKGEITFTVGEVPITMRILNADEDMAVQRYAREDVEGDDEDNSAMRLLERFKRATLAYSIVQIGDTDLRNDEFIATGEMTDKGVPVRVPRQVAVRKIIDGWTRTATLSLFQKYLELTRRADADAEKAIQFNTADLDTEIERVERRLTELKQEREKAEKFKSGNPNPAAVIANADKMTQERLHTIAAHAGGQVPTPTSPPPAATLPEEPKVEVKVGQAEVPMDPMPPRPSSPPPAATTASRQRVMPPTVAPPVPPPMPPVAPQAAPAQPTPVDGSFDSMVDSLSDSPEAVAAETARLMAARNAARRASLQSTNDSPEVIDNPVGRRVPPHRAAANAADAVVDSDVGSLRATRVTGPVEGVETYRLDPTPLSDRGRPPVDPRKRVPVNETEKKGPTNPRFKPVPR